MENYKKVVNANLAALGNSRRTFRDIYSVIFSHKDHIAYEYMENYEIKRVTYRELGDRVCMFARSIRRRYPEMANEYIGVDFPNTPNFIIAFWAVLQSGNKPYLVNSYYPPRLRNQLLATLRVRLVITDSEEYPQFDVITIDHDAHEAHDAHGDIAAGEHGNGTWADEIALSSSMTGLEARICVYNGNSVASQIGNARGILEKNKWLMLDYNRNIKIIAILPFFHIFGLVVSYFWFSFFGRTIVFLRNYSPETIRSTIQMHQVTHVFAPPILYHMLHRNIMNAVSQESDKTKKRFLSTLKLTYTLQNIFPLWGVQISKVLFREIIDATFGKSVRFMITGGTFIDKNALRLINNIGYPLFNGYGTTEASITSVELRKRMKHRVSGAIGAPLDSVTYSLSDEGALLISGGSVCGKIISINGDVTAVNNCIQSNDIARERNGQYYIEGRQSDVYIGENGENISPDMIQNELHVKIAQRFCVVELDGKLSLVLEYNPQLPDLIVAKEVGRIKRELHDVPFGAAVKDIFITHDPISNENAIKTGRDLLRTMIANGDVRLQKAAVFEAREDKQNGIAHDDPGVALIKRMFQKALEKDADGDIDVNAHFFFDLGGDSLSYFALISELDAVFNIQINLEKKNNLYTVIDIYTYLAEMEIL